MLVLYHVLHQRNPIQILGAIVAVLSLCACSLPGNQRVPVTTYVLEWPGKLAAPPGPSPARYNVLVDVPSAAPGFDTAEMAYVKKPFRLDYYAQHRWADNPARMMEPLLVRALQSSGLFRAVAATPAPLDAQLRLESQVLQLQQVFTDDASVVQLGLRVNVFDIRRRRLLLSRIFSSTVKAPENNPYGGAVAANRAVANVLNQMVGYLAEHIPDNLSCDSVAAVERC